MTMHSFENRPISPITYVLRCTIVVSMIVAVATLLHFSHYRPKQTFLSCDRPCHHLDWPMICRVKLTLEVFQSLGKSCGSCPVNETTCLTNHCVSADGQKRGLLTANRQMPGPSIQVCENDILVVDVVNRLPDKTASIHWRGQTQTETPCMDGAPLVTQCPIPSYTTFQYKFRAATPGTHLWHAHAGSDVANGIFGSLIVRQADIREPHRALYDVDDPNHVILVTKWQDFFTADVIVDPRHSKASILLVNGRGRRPNGPTVPLTTFTVIPGRRHRFRIANAGGATSCPTIISIDDHPLLLIALDGHPVEPRQVTSITLAKGERADFVLKANRPVDSYWLNVQATKECESTSLAGKAILRYTGSPEVDPYAPGDRIVVDDDNDDNDVEDVAMTTDLTDKCETLGKLCVTTIQGMRKMPKLLSERKMDVTMYLPINYRLQTTDFTGSVETKVFSVDNVTFTFPSSPLLTQRADVSKGMLCSGGGAVGQGESDEKDESLSLTHRRRNVDDYSPALHECVHVRRVPLGATVEIILLDQGGLDDLVYHLHGYSFHVVGARRFGRSVSVRDIEDLDDRGVLFDRNLDCPAEKDTVAVPKYGAVALRFKADNPGYWMLRDEHASYWTRGLDVILQVGESADMIPAPQDFPKCGSFVGPDYFLI